MLNTEERVLAVKLRAKEIQAQKRKLKGHIFSISALVTSLLIIVGLAYLIPSVTDSMPNNEYRNFGLGASIFVENNFLGYVFIGFLAFALGISVTILAYKIKLKSQLEERANDD